MAAISRPIAVFVDESQGRWQGLSVMRSNDMNDFLRPCNCVHPSEDDCEKCIEEADVKKDPAPNGANVSERRSGVPPLPSEKSKRQEAASPLLKPL